MTRRVSILRKLLGKVFFALTAVGTFAVVCCQAAGQAAAPPAQGAALKAPVYDVVSIRPHKPTSDGSSWGAPTADGYSARNIPLRRLMVKAYNLKSSDQLSGLPEWADSEPFDIEAKMDDADIAAFHKLSLEQQWDQAALMLQSLLADRFKLQIRHSIKELPVYELVVAKGGPKLKESRGAVSLDGMVTRPGQIYIPCGPIGRRFIYGLSDEVGRIVIDKTGLTGYYDITLKWTPDRSQTSDPNAPPDLFTALEEQLGLKLVSIKAPVDVIVVDHVERPSEN